MLTKRVVVAVAIVVVGLIVLGRAGSVLVAWQWFLSLGYVGVFSTIFTTRAVLFFAVFALSTGALWMSGGLALRFARQSAPWLSVPTGSPLQLLGSSPRFPWRLVVAGVAAAIGLMIAATELSSWDLALPFLYGVPYGASDPVFGHDIGFYLFSLPAYVEVKNWLLLVLFFAAVLAGVVYWARGDIELDRQPLRLSPACIAHGSALLGLYFVVKALSYGLDRFLLLYSDNDVVVGAGYTDLHVRLPVLWFLIALAGVLAIASWANIVRWRSWRVPAAAAALLFASSIMMGVIFPALFQRFYVKPSELQLETPYIERNIALTQAAYNLNRIEGKPFPVENGLNYATLAANRATVQNIRLWDGQPLATTYAQLQEIRTYSKFLDIDIDRYRLEGDYRQRRRAAPELGTGLLS